MAALDPAEERAPHVAWLHVGDLHLDAADGWESLPRLREIVAQVNAHGEGLDFVYLPGDNANHGRPEEYARMTAALAALSLPWYIIPGDHDFEPHSLAAYDAAVPPAHRPDLQVIAGHRCLFLDIVSAGAGGPDFRLPMHDRNRIREELARAAAYGQVPLVFMHAYPGDLAADGDEVARAFAEGGVRFVDTGHTHFNELLNDGRTVYGATRSTAQIEEDGGRPGFAIVAIHGGVPSWRFRRLDAAWPHVQIVSPCDRRLVTRPADPREVPRPGPIEIVATCIGAASEPLMVALDGGAPQPMAEGTDRLWRATIEIAQPGLHEIVVTSGAGRDTIDLLVREAEHIPKRRVLAAPGRDCHAIGAWPAAGLLGSQLGPNRNGGPW